MCLTELCHLVSNAASVWAENLFIVTFLFSLTHKPPLPLTSIVLLLITGPSRLTNSPTPQVKGSNGSIYTRSGGEPHAPCGVARSPGFEPR
jgi:hypothetical protein